MRRFRATLHPVPHGGLYVIVPAAAATGLAHGARVCGRVGGAPYRSSLMKYSGVFHLGIHKPALAQAGVGEGARVEVTIERDDEPLPTDVVPAWQELAPARRRGYVGEVIGAKQPETRARRIAKIVETLRAGVPPRRTWTPPSAPAALARKPRR
jgi:Bacteriocin-protection, YdeI or OmpD-Associated/Domain of unknown function (DUF1905)